MGGVSLTTVSKSFGAISIIDRLSLDIGQGELVVFLGPSGCGKSTLLRMIAGLETVDAGEIHIAGRRVDRLAPGDRGVAMVFQHYALYPHMSVRENMAFGLRNARVAPDDIERRIAEAARSLEIADYLDRKPGQLSGGQRQRVAIARAIVKEPALFLLDEPLSNLDAALRVRTRLELAQLHRRLGATMVFVTHDQVEAMTLADRIVVLNGGRIEQVAAPMDIYLKPRTRFVASFVGTPRINLLPVTLAEPRDGDAVVQLGDGTTIATQVAAGGLSGALDLGLRAESVRIADPATATVRATAEIVERLGERTLVHARLADGSSIVAEDAGVSHVRAGDAIGLHVDAGAAHLFDSDGIGHHARAAA